MLYFTSDLHVGHAKIIKDCRRPFSSVEEMNELLIQYWNDTVKPQDDVYILGDFALKLSLEETHALFERLCGHLHLIFGNHDHEITRHRYFFRDVLESMHSLSTLRIMGDKRLILCHYPLMFWCGDYEDRFIHLYGHIHNNAQDNIWASYLRNACNVGVDVNNYHPVSLDEILEKIKVHNAQLPLDQCINPPLNMRNGKLSLNVCRSDLPVANDEVLTQHKD